jgi:co-chaperonin GroES (HSP10)
MNKIAKPLNGIVLVKIASEFQETIGSFIAYAGDTTILDEKQDTIYNPHDRKTIKGTVVEPPRKVSEFIYYMVYEGHPKPQSYREGGINRVSGLTQYNCSAHTPEFITSKNTPIEVTKGDTVYFHYLSNDNKNTLEIDGEYYHMIEYRNLFAVKSNNNELKMLNNRVFVKPYYDQKYKDVELGKATIKAELTDSGLVAEIKSSPKAQFGVVEHIGEGYGPEAKTLSKGDIVIFTKGSEFTNEIDGEEYYTMKHEDIAATVIDGFIIPLQNWVVIKKDTRIKKDTLVGENEYNPKIHQGKIITLTDERVQIIAQSDYQRRVGNETNRDLYSRTKSYSAKSSMIPDTGVVISCVSKELAFNDKIKYAHKSKMLFDIDGTDESLIRIEDIYGIIK